MRLELSFSKFSNYELSSLPTISLWSHRESRKVWIGLIRRNDEWLWAERNNSVIYSNWNKLAGTNETHTCAYMKGTSKGTWFTADCTERGQPLCEASMGPHEDSEIKALITPKVEDFVTPESCAFLNGQKICMRFVRLQKDQASARGFCQSKYGLAWPSTKTDLGPISQEIFIRLGVMTMKECTDMVSDDFDSQSFGDSLTLLLLTK